MLVAAADSAGASDLGKSVAGLESGLSALGALHIVPEGLEPRGGDGDCDTDTDTDTDTKRLMEQVRHAETRAQVRSRVKMCMKKDAEMTTNFHSTTLQRAEAALSDLKMTTAAASADRVGTGFAAHTLSPSPPRADGGAAFSILSERIVGGGDGALRTKGGAMVPSAFSLPSVTASSLSSPPRESLVRPPGLSNTLTPL